MGLLTKIVNFIAKASIPTFKFENNQLHFKLKNDEFYEYDLVSYEIKTRHDSYILEAYTLYTEDIFLEYIRLDPSAAWRAQPLSLYEGFFKEKLAIKEFLVVEKKEIGNYTFKIYKIEDSFVFHMIYISTAISDIMIIDTKGELYKNLLFRLDGKYIYKYEDEEKGSINFNISMVKENAIRGFFHAEESEY